MGLVVYPLGRALNTRWAHNLPFKPLETTTILPPNQERERGKPIPSLTNSGMENDSFPSLNMLKGKLKLPEKARRVFPDRLGSLVSGVLEDNEAHGGGLEFEPGEELEIIQPNGVGLGVGVLSEETEYGYVEDEMCADEEMVGGRDHQEGRDRFRSEKAGPGQGSVSAREAIAADEKRSDLAHELSQKEINLEKLQRIASTGLPDGGSLRATVWKLLLDYLPPSRDLWDQELSENRKKYAKLKEEMLFSPSELALEKDDASSSTKIEAEGDPAGRLKRHGISHGDHPLSDGKASAWSQYFKHTEIAEQIDRDLQRTHPDMKFFSGETPFSKRNREAMRCILRLFAKLNPAIGYVQGMNEVLAPIFYVFSSDIEEQNIAHVEADSFACFVRILGDSVDHFCQQLDNSPVGILATLSRLADLLKANDEQLWRHLEFKTKDMLLRICCAMLLCVKDRLLSGDFAGNLRLLQHYPDIDIEHLLRVARDLSPDTSSYRLSR